MKKQNIFKSSRRKFLLAGLATTALNGVFITFNLEGNTLKKFNQFTEPFTKLTHWFQFTKSKKINIVIPSAEMGQGISTALAQILADELDFEWEKVHVIQAPLNEVYRNPERDIQYTGGSSSVKQFYLPFRKVGAGVRQMILKAASIDLNVNVQNLTTHKGFIYHNNTSYSYFNFLNTALTLDIPEDPILKNKKQHNLIGKSIPRIDNLQKTTGKALYGIDVNIQNMLIASVIQSPYFDGEPIKWNEKLVLKQKGIQQIIKLPNAIAVTGNKFWQVKKALPLLEPEFSKPDNHFPSENTREIFIAFKKALDDKGKGVIKSNKKIDVEYQVPYLAHATLEPMNCTVYVQSERADVWLPTQGPEAVAKVISDLTDLDYDQIFVHNTFIGGGYGRRIETDFVSQAVLISQSTKRPIKLIWSREEDLQHDFYRPAVVCRFQIGIDDKNNPIEWYHQFTCSSVFKRITKDSWIPLTKLIGDPIMQVDTDNPPYVSEDAEVDVNFVIVDASIPVGFWPSVAYSHNTFFRESVIDEIAYKANEDPYVYRSRLLKKIPRKKSVLDIVAKIANWGKCPSNRFQGIAVESAFNSYFAMVAEISVENNVVMLHKISCCVDCGIVINPDIVIGQFEFGISFALSAVAYGEITLNNGKIEQSNFHDYQVIHMNQMPEVNVHIVDSNELPGGIGETGIPTLAPALTNAIYAATKKRIRRLPITKEGFHLGELII